MSPLEALAISVGIFLSGFTFAYWFTRPKRKSLDEELTEELNQLNWNRSLSKQIDDQMKLLLPNTRTEEVTVIENGEIKTEVMEVETPDIRRAGLLYEGNQWGNC